MPKSSPDKNEPIPPESTKADATVPAAPKGLTEVKGQPRIFVGGLQGKPTKASPKPE